MPQVLNPLFIKKDKMGRKRFDLSSGKKICSLCKKPKDLTDFHKSSKKNGCGIRPDCKECERARTKRYYRQKHPNYKVRISTIESKEHRKNGEKHCYKCNKWISFALFRKCKGNLDGLNSECSLCQRKEYFDFKHSLYVLISNDRIKCVMCGEDDERCLQIDHVKGKGGLERKSLGGCRGVYKQIKDHPEDYQILCANCNWKKKYDNNENPKSILTTEEEKEWKESLKGNYDGRNCRT